MKTVIIIHGWQGKPNRGWFVWLKKELEKSGIECVAPKMPNPAFPKMKPWVGLLDKLLKDADEDTYLIGHSIGCQTIMRSLAKRKKPVGGCIFVAGWFNLKEEAYTEYPKYEKETRAIARPWIKTKFNIAKTKKNVGKISAIFSTNDPYVPLSDSKLFKQLLGSKIIIEKNKDHYYEAKMKRIPILLKELKQMMRK